MEDYILRVDGLKKAYGSLPALKDISFQVRPGELFGLVGPDGAGKTTLIKLLAGLVFADSGAALVKGIDVSQKPQAVRSMVGYMPQHFSLYPDLSVEENLRFYADLYGVAGAERERRLRRLYDFSRLEPFRKRPAGKLSGGMKQKLALSATLIGGPDLLLLDEPTTGVDPVSRRELWDILAELVDDGITILVSTPYMDEASKCGRVALLHEGGVLAVDRPAALTRLFGGVLLEIRGPDLHALAAELRKLDRVDWVQPLGDRLHAAAASITIEETKKFLGETSLEIESVKEIEPDMEDVFLSLMGTAP